MNMKNLILTLLILISFNNKILSQFSNIGGPIGVDNPIFKFDGNRIYVGSSAAIHYSDNKGQSWKQVKGSQDLGYIFDFDVEENKIAVLAEFDEFYSGKLFHTSDLGDSWSELLTIEVWSNDVILDYHNDTITTGSLDRLYFLDHTILFDSIQIDQYSTSIFHIDNSHYIGNYNFLLKTKNYTTFDTIIKASDDEYLNFYRNELNLFLTQTGSDSIRNFKLVNDSFIILPDKNINISYTDVSYSHDTIFSFDSYTLQMYDANLNEVKRIDLYSILNNSPDKVFFNREYLYYQYYNNTDIYRLNFYNPNASEQKITTNLKSTRYAYENINNKLWNPNSNYDYFQSNSNQWLKLNVDYDNDYYGFINENELIIRKWPDFEVVDTLSQKIRDLNVPFVGYDEFKHCNDLLIGTDSYDKCVYYSKDKGMSWDSITFSSEKFDYYTSYSNGYYIVFNDEDELFYSKDAVSWNRVSFNVNLPGARLIYFVQISNSGDIYIGGYSADIYKYNPSNLQWTLLKSPPVFNSWGINRDFSDFVVYKNVLIGSYFGQGIHISFNNGETWEQFDDGIPNKFIGDLTVINDEIFASTNCHVYRRSLSELNAGYFKCLVFEDENQNGIKETSESGVENINVATSLNSIVTSTDQNGEVEFLSRIIAGNKISTIVPKHAKATNGPLDFSNPDTRTELGLFFDKNVRDIGVSIHNIGVFRPGFKGSMLIVVENLSYLESPINSDVTLQYDPLLQLISSTYPYTLSSNNSVLFENIVLGPHEKLEILIDFRLDPNTVIGKILPFNCDVSIDSGVDVDPDNNIASEDVIVVGSYDPNDKAASPASDIPVNQGLNNNEMVYKIRFQNTGNYPAEFVRVIDTLDYKFDIRTLKIISTSHQVEWHLKENNVLDFYFPEINLIDSFSNEALSHGYIVYSIKMNGDSKLGDNFKNTAYIYFDYNKPVITNTVSTSIVLPVFTYDRQELDFKVFPIPTTDQLNWLIDDNVKVNLVEIYTSTGKLVLHHNNINDIDGISIQSIYSGHYFIVLHTNYGRLTSMFTKL